MTIASVEVVVFLVIFRLFPKIYEPRSYLPPKPEDRAKKLPKRAPWQTLLSIWAAPEEDVLQHNGLDAYMFLQYLKMLFVLPLLAN